MMMMMTHDSDDDDELAADPLAAFKAGGRRPSNNHNHNHNHSPSASSTPATATAPAPPTFVPSGSGFTSINRPSNVPTPVASASQSRAEDDADPLAFDANNIPVGDGDSEDEADVAEETRRPVSSTPSAHRVKRSGQTRPRSATRERTRSRQATEEADHGRGHGHVQDQLVPILPRAASESDDGDIIDMTAGDDVVRRVLAEADGVGGEIVYKVELGDYSIEEVRMFFCRGFPFSSYWLLPYNHYYPHVPYKPLQLRLKEIC